MKNNVEFYNCVVNSGHLAFTREPTLLSSVCGCGVVVTVWDRIKRRGGMAHCVFPKLRFREKPTNYHVDVAIPLLMRQFFNYASYSERLEAQIFGGGHLRGVSQRLSAKTVKATRKALKRFHVMVTSEDIGGSVGRKIIFNTFSGDVMVWKTKKIRMSDWNPEYLLK